MVELFILVKLSHSIKQIVMQKGYKAWPYQLLFVGMWLGGEIIGGIGGLLLLGEFQVFGYVIALFFAILGGAIAYKIAERLPNTLVHHSNPIV